MKKLSILVSFVFFSILATAAETPEIKFMPGVFASAAINHIGAGLNTKCFPTSISSVGPFMKGVRYGIGYCGVYGIQKVTGSTERQKSMIINDPLSGVVNACAGGLSGLVSAVTIMSDPEVKKLPKLVRAQRCAKGITSAGGIIWALSTAEALITIKKANS